MPCWTRRWLGTTLALALLVGCRGEEGAGIGAKATTSEGAGKGGDLSFEGCTGASATENGATVSLRGQAAWSVGRAGCGLDFDGKTSSVDLGRAYLAASRSFSVATWVQLGDAESPSTLISAPGRQQSGFALRYTGADDSHRPGHIALAIQASDTRKAQAVTLEGNIAVPPKRWTHVAATFDAEAKIGRVYVDGALAAEGTLPVGAQTDGATLLGAEWQESALTRPFDGRLDEVVLRPSVLTAADVTALQAQGAISTPLRAPATPLLVRDPYMSSWHMHDPNGLDWTRFWTGAVRALSMMAKIDGSVVQLMGGAPPDGVSRATETQREVTPTETRTTFVAKGVALHVAFVADLDPNVPARLSAPFGSVLTQVQAVDGRTHDVTLYADVSGEWAHADVATAIDWTLVQNTIGPINYQAFHVVPTGATSVAELNDAQRWGEQWWAGSGPGAMVQSGRDAEVRAGFAATGKLTNAQDASKPRAINSNWPIFAFAFSLGSVSGTLSEPVTLTLGQVRTPAVVYDGAGLAPYWTTQWSSSGAMLGDVHVSAATSEVRVRNAALDRRLLRDATAAGGPKYAALCALSLRQLFGGLQFVRYGNQLWAFLKEISSNGNMSTVDVLYPSMPGLLYVQPALLRHLLEPIFAYSESGDWTPAFAPHDLGVSFPNATLHNDGGGENMPVEESANMILMTAAYALLQNDATASSFVSEHYTVLSRWANYLVDNTLDPNLQNQTDDFTGFVAHSSNLALKGILALGAMGQLATRIGKSADASRFSSLASTYIQQWMALSLSADKSHLKFAYDQDASWSQKYNVFADKLLGLKLVPEAIYALEAAHYKTTMNTYGLPLDSRHTYTKLDWSLWTAGATEDMELRDALIAAAYRYANETPSRVPLSDWFDTKTGAMSGFAARPVVGGVYSLLARARAEQ